MPALLERGFSVLGVDRLPCVHLLPAERFEFRQMDIDDLHSLEGMDYVIHLAFATSIPGSMQDPVGTTYNNIDLGVKMLQRAKEAHVKKFLYPSTASLYGNQPLPWRETMSAYPAEPYSLQKYALERFCQYYAAQGLPTVIFRLFQVFGERQRADQVLAKFFQCRKEGKPIPVTQTDQGGNGASARRDFVYVGDIAEIFCEALTSDRVGKGEIINIASGSNYTIREIAELISSQIEIIPKRSFDLDEHLADITKAKELLGWKAKTDIKAWLRNHLKTL